MAKVAGIRRTGAASLDLAWTAAGRFDGYWEYGLQPWDLAAGILMVREAGGFVTDLDGGTEMMTSGDVIVGNTHVRKELIDTYITARPVTGYGYGGFWTTRHVLALSLLQRGTVYYHSHSGYLEMALSIGIVGALVHVLTIAMSLGKSLARGVLGDPVEAFAAGVLIMLMVGMSAEPVNMSAYLMPTFLAMILISKYAFVESA